MAKEATSVVQAAQKAKAAALQMAGLSVEKRDHALMNMAEAIEKHRDEILAENQKDIDAAEQLVKDGKITAAAAKRLNLQGAKFDGVVEGLRSVATLSDPIGKTLMATELDEGLNLYRVSCPIGVIAVIFESRPDALPQIASLCLKSGNALLLKGGSEAMHSNRVLARVLDEAAQGAGIPAGWMSLLETRGEIAEVLKLDEYVDLIIPRGSNDFVRYIMDNTNIPVTGHRDGICHTYIHDGADPEKAVRIAVDGKTQYPAVCNATETLLIDQAAAPMLPAVARALMEKGVEIHADDATRKIIEQDASIARDKIVAATDADWDTEFLDLVIGLKMVGDLDAAIAHINAHGSHHTDSIVTEDADAAEKFIREVDSSSVLHNCSTRFADGFRYGLGAEVGISTEKIHSRGPVGLEGLTIYKYILRGQGQIVADYSGSGGRKFTHRRLPVE
ncbi:MAG: glutamate-5-semialdehyde dehydrogenase [Candidatus Sumerlaeia bacterium]